MGIFESNDALKIVFSEQVRHFGTHERGENHDRQPFKDKEVDNMLNVLKNVTYLMGQLLTKTHCFFHLFLNKHGVFSKVIKHIMLEKFVEGTLGIFGTWTVYKLRIDVRIHFGIQDGGLQYGHQKMRYYRKAIR